MNWQNDAACRTSRPELFEHDWHWRAAIQWCHTCPVRQSCLEQAMTFNEYGIWGGTTRKMRLDLAAQMNRKLLPIVPKDPYRRPNITPENRARMVESGRSLAARRNAS